MDVTICDHCNLRLASGMPRIAVTSSGRTTHFCTISCLCDFLKSSYPGEFARVPDKFDRVQRPREFT